MCELSTTLRELAAICWREGDVMHASALHTQALLLEAGIDRQPVEPIEAIRARMKELQQAGRRVS